MMNATNTTVVYVNVTGRCRNCPVTESGSFTLFEDAFRRLSYSEQARPSLSTPMNPSSKR
jgi:Fe-S cluster biogenesis protein NfuA